MQFRRDDLARAVSSLPFLLSTITLYIVLMAFAMYKGRIYGVLGSGTLNIFIQTIIENNDLPLFFVVLCVIPGTASLCDDFTSGIIRAYIIRMPIKKYLSAKIASAFLVAFFSFLLAFLVFFISLYIMFPQPSIRTGQMVGDVRYVYYRSLLLFCLLYIIQMSVTGGIVSLFGSACALFTEKRLYGVVAPIAIYFVLMFFGRLFFIEDLMRLVYKMLPVSWFSFTNVSFYTPIYNYVVLVSISLILIYIKINKWRCTTIKPI